MSYAAMLAHYIRVHGPIETARVSSAQSSTRYDYWGVVRYQIRLTRDGQPANRPTERASSDRRSTRLVEEDCDSLCDSEDRIRVQHIGRLTEEICREVLERLATGDPNLTAALARRASRSKPSKGQTLPQRLVAYKAARREAETRLRLTALDEAGIRVRGQRGGYIVSSTEYPLYSTNGHTYRIMMSMTEPCSCSADITADLPPTVDEARLALACASEANFGNSLRLRDARLEDEARNRAKYEADAAAATPQGRIVFDAEGSFRVIQSDN